MPKLFAKVAAPEPLERLRPEPVTRLASLRNALRVVDDFGGGPAPDCDSGDFDDEISARWERADEAARRCFDRRSAELVAGASAGMDAVFAQRQRGLEVSVAALQVIAEELKAGLKDLKRIFTR